MRLCLRARVNIVLSLFILPRDIKDYLYFPSWVCALGQRISLASQVCGGVKSAVLGRTISLTWAGVYLLVRAIVFVLHSLLLPTLLYYYPGLLDRQDLDNDVLASVVAG